MGKNGGRDEEKKTGNLTKVRESWRMRGARGLWGSGPHRAARNVIAEFAAAKDALGAQVVQVAASLKYAESPVLSSSSTFTISPHFTDHDNMRI
jgi:hypothetical protein